MNDKIKLGHVSIPVLEYASQGNAALGIKGSGKTYGMTGIAEQLLDKGIPFIAFDPIGVWRNLKIPGAGKGYKVVVAHPSTGDVPLTPESAPEIVRAAMRENIPLVIDLYDMRLSKADWKRIVESSIRLLLYENGPHGLRHIFIEEASEFCPQVVSSDNAKVYAEIEKLARMGGNASLGYTLINQRSEQVNKAVLELCDCLFLFRQKGKNSLTALGKWLDFAGPEISKEIIKSLPTLPAGDCWAWLQGSENPERIHMPAKNSFHPDRQNPNPQRVAAKADVSAFVTTLNGSLQKFIAKAAESDPIALKKKIAELQKQLESVKPERVEVSVIDDTAKELLTKVSEMLGNVVAQFSSRKPMPIVQRPIRREVVRHVHKSTPVDNSLGKCARAVLTAAAQRHPFNSKRAQLAIISGYSVTSGGFANTLSELRTAGFLTGPGDDLEITESGLDAVGEVKPLPVGDELLQFWMRHPSLGLCERTLLQRIYDAGIDGISRSDLAEATGYSASSGGFSNSLSVLRTLQLINRSEPIEASATLL